MTPSPPTDALQVDPPMKTEAPQVFRLAATEPRLPDEVPAPPPGIGTVVAVLTDPAARVDGWASSLLIQMARRWSDSGLRVVLADGDLQTASLGRELGHRSGEGLSDLVLYGSSPARLAAVVSGAGFRFIPAGTVVSDGAATYGHPRWGVLLAAFREAGAVLLLHLPADSPGTVPLAHRADRVVRLLKEDQGCEEVAGEVVFLVRGPEPQPVPPTTRGAGPALRRGPPTWIPLVVLVALALAIVLAGVLGLVTIPGITPEVGDLRSVPDPLQLVSRQMAA